MKNFIIKLAKNIFLQILSLAIIIGGVVFAATITWPNSAPDGQVEGGTFQTNFDTIFGTITIKNHKVGIGKDPQHKLDVDGNIKADRLCLSGVCKSSWPDNQKQGLYTLLTYSTGHLYTDSASQKIDKWNYLITQTANKYSDLKIYVGNNNWETSCLANSDGSILNNTYGQLQNCGDWVCKYIGYSLNKTSAGISKANHCGVGARTCPKGGWNINCMFK